MKTTKRHFEYFRERCLYYQKELGLLDWEVTALHTSDPTGYAHCVTASKVRICRIELSTKDWSDLGWKSPTRRELDILAYHEMIHLRLADLAALGERRHTTEREFDVEVERAVTALENFHRSHY